jgi:hypothetical protein
VGCLTWGIGAFYTLYLNPEISHYAAGAVIKSAWAERLTREYGAKIVAVGGSSCEFSLDGERMLSVHHLPLVNYCWQVGMGAAIMVESGISALAPGDTLIVAVEPVLLTVPFDQTSLGIQLSVAAHHREWTMRPALGVGATGWFQSLASLRPGGQHAVTLMAKLLRGQQLYRYRASDYHASGWKQTEVRTPFEGPSWHHVTMSDDARRLFRNLAEWCQAHEVRVAYSLPWSFTPAVSAAKFRQENIEFLTQVVSFFPVLKDLSLGVDPLHEHYADTSFHLNGAGAMLRTDELAHQIEQWDTWSAAELQALRAPAVTPSFAGLAPDASGIDHVHD